MLKPSFSIVALTTLVFALGSAAAGDPPIHLHDAVGQGKVSIEVTAIGGSTGDTIQVAVRRLGKDAIHLDLAPGTVFGSTSATVQDMVGSRIKGERAGTTAYSPLSAIYLPDDQVHTYVIEAYCMDFHKANPAAGNKFRMDAPSPELGSMLAGASGRSIQQVQAAIWIKRDGVADAELAARFPVRAEDLRAARTWLLDLAAQQGTPQARPQLPTERSPTPQEPPVDIKRGDHWTNPTTGSDMVYIPSGVFRRRGSDSFGADIPVVDPKTGKPAYTIVTVKQVPWFVTGFLIDAGEVTNEAYATYVVSARVPAPMAWPNGKIPLGKEKHPALVSRDEAIAYARWAGADLPSFREYLAAIADSGGNTPWTEDLGVTKDLDIRNGAPESPVGSDKMDTSPTGVHDVLGHALEWTRDEMGLATAPGDNRAEGYGVFFLKDFSGGMLVWGVASPETVKMAGFRCVHMSMPGILARPLAPPLDFSREREEFGWKVARLQVQNDTASGVTFCTSSGLRLEVPARATRDALLLPGIYLTWSVPSIGGGASRIYLRHLMPDVPLPQDPYGKLRLQESGATLEPR